MAQSDKHLVQLITTKEDFESQLKEAGPTKLVIVDFFAQWCGPCKKIAPEVEKLAAVMTDVMFLKVDVDQVEELASEYSISCMPTFVAIVNGKRVGDITGGSIDKLKKFVLDNKTM